MTDKVVEVGNLKKSFGDVVALKDVTFDVERAQTYVLLGPSGCGKSTTLEIIAGLQEPDEGSVRIMGKEMKGVPPQERPTTTAFQSWALFPHKTVGENVAFGLRMKNVPEDEIKKRVSETLKLVGLAGYEDRYPPGLSGGEKQRVSFARTLVPEPEVVLLDEPLSNLDRKLREDMRVLLTEILDDLSMTSTYVTHDQQEAFTLGDKIAVMGQGIISQEGGPEDLYETPANPHVASFIGDSNILEGVIEKETDEEIEAYIESLDKSIKLVKKGEVEEEDKVKIYIRPSTIEILSKETKEEDNKLKILFMRKIFQGDDLRYLLEMEEGREIIVDSEKYIEIEEGEELLIKIPKECIYFSTES
ncbi:hypothetical protein AKJ49_00865 [candidate division MSBL1 archaeon SCGC-AAA382A03]|uniref:Molybdate/tungstate import ATP-binding protein WtpC n=1 Tax=candidate division MSBL1 archaeon SCGC-AAA382A03 TaxID=1698278 RepID=A0A133VG54_9EURY|nr:hypothetical protein AKJ49_00865 [candidate division MSBL1 archaeon SCGC-AAA382A03]